MPTNNPTGFCPRCNQNVLLTRKEFDTCLAIILLIFTVIGFFIYLAVYYSRKEDRCVHCGTQITVSESKRSYVYQPQIQNQSTLSPTTENISEEIGGVVSNFCALCGEKLDPGIKFCPNCGSRITGN
ncbi:MAG: zinc-ribbon domain-containing protein [Candidatus Thorarchaeota archaeon]